MHYMNGSKPLQLILLMVLSALIFSPAGGYAETESARKIDEPEQNPTIQNLLERIKVLEHQASKDTLQDEIMIAEIKPEYPALRMLGFTDFTFSTTDETGKSTGFREGQFVLHFSSALSQRVSYFAEVSMTPRKDAGTGDPTASGFDVEVERSIIRFDQGDHLKVAAGRFHTPINWWNTTFHHGAWLQTSIGRPEMIGAFVPVHFLGGILEGNLPSGELNLYYHIGIGNGRAEVISRAGDAGDINNTPAWLFNLTSRPDRFFGLQLGVAVYGDKITKSNGREFKEIISAAHIVWNKENPEIIIEGANVHHEAINGGAVFDHQAFYIQLAYRLPVLQAAFKPYARFEYSDIDQADPAFEMLDIFEKAAIAGIRYDLTTHAALKFEYRLQKKKALSEINSGFAQVSFTF